MVSLYGQTRTMGTSSLYVPYRRHLPTEQPTVHPINDRLFHASFLPRSRCALAQSSAVAFGRTARRPNAISVTGAGTQRMVSRRAICHANRSLLRRLWQHLDLSHRQSGQCGQQSVAGPFRSAFASPPASHRDVTSFVTSRLIGNVSRTHRCLRNPIINGLFCDRCSLTRYLQDYR